MGLRAAILLLLIGYSTVGAADGNFILNDGKSEVSVLAADVNRTDIDLRISKIDYKQLVQDGNRSYSISLPDDFGVSRGAILSSSGSVIPTVTRLIAVPFDSDPQVQIVGSHFVDLPGITLAPATPEELESYTKENSIVGEFGNEPVFGEIAGQMRDIRLYSITISPVQYDQANSILRVYDDIEIEVTHSGSRLTQVDGQVSEAFLPIYKSILDNALVFDPVQVTRGAYWIIYPDAFFDHVQPIGEWKRAKGFEVDYIPKSAIGSSPTYITIKNYIAARYDTCQVKPDYITIVADVTMPSGYGIPTRTYQNPYGFGDIESDNYYTFLFGNDYFPDILIGRIAVDYTSELDNFKDKLFTYERTPYMENTSWYLQATVSAGGENGYFESPMMTKLWCRDAMLEAGFTSVDTLFEYYWGQIPAYMVTASINRGVSYVNYRGWGAANGWSSPSYTTYDMNALTNGPEYAVLTSIVCGTGDYNDGTDVCMGEAWIRYGGKGGPGFIGNSNHDAHTQWTNALDVGIYWGWFYAGVTTLAQGELMGKMTLYNAFPDDRAPGGQVELYFNSYNDLGDPELNCWTGIPKDMTVSHPDTIEFGQNLISISVLNSSGEPFEGAYVCLLKAGEVFAGDFVPASGTVNLIIQPSTAGNMAITVTARGIIPYEDTIAIVSNAVTVEYESHSVDDDSTGESSGNGDGICNPSETIELPATLKNFGSSETAFGVTAVLTSENPYVEIIRSSANYGDIAPSASGTPDAPFLIKMASNTPNGAIIDFILNISDDSSHSWQSMIRLTTEAADLALTGFNVFDGGDGDIDPGEVVMLLTNFENIGGSAIIGANAVLRTSDDQVTIFDSTAYFGDCPPGGTFSNSGDTFTIAVDPSIYVGHLINFTLEFQAAGPQVETSAFSHQVGVVSSDDPIGPDNYGYYCFDNSDTAYIDHPQYQWVPIETQNWNYVMLDDDDSHTIDLPFEVYYYGQSFSQASICDNGFIAFGHSWWNAFLNTSIPAPQNAEAMVAAFWDDFVQDNLKIYYHYDQVNSRFIIGWNSAWDSEVYRNETFEIIILDRLAWPSLTGDNEFIIQYQQAQSTYSASVGICSPDRRDGICYSFNDDYAAGAAPLGNSRALKFTTGSAYLTETPGNSGPPREFSLSQNYPNPFNASTAIEFSLPLPGDVSVEIFNIMGQKVATIARGHFEAGFQKVIWNAENTPSGVYFYKVTAPGFSDSKRMTLLK